MATLLTKMDSSHRPSSSMYNLCYLQTQMEKPSPPRTPLTLVLVAAVTLTLAAALSLAGLILG